MSEIISAQHTITPSGASSPFSILATQYFTKVSSANTTGLTLIFLHAVGLHKETWEPIVRKLFELDMGNPPRIRDMFSIEIPNHGESALVNEQVINEQFPESWPTRIIAQATYDFLSAGPPQGAKVDFTKRNIIGIGHSIGAAALFLMMDIKPNVHFKEIIAIEPGISIKELPGTHKSSQMLTAWTWLRRDVWASREAARKDLLLSPVYSLWDKRVLDLYIKHGLRIHSAAKYSAPFSFRGVTTCSSKAQEAACYRSEHLVVDAMNAYTRMTSELAVHIIFGSIHDVGGEELQHILSDNKAGRHPASVSYIEGAGHLAVQQRPDKVALRIYDILVGVRPLHHGRL